MGFGDLLRKLSLDRYALDRIYFILMRAYVPITFWISQVLLSFSLLSWSIR